MLQDDLLQSYMETFYGYGSYTGRYWFVGMEEGGGTSEEAISSASSGDAAMLLAA